MSALQYRRLSGDEADQAYVIARMADSTLTMDAWRARVAAAPAAGGVMAAVAGGGVGRQDATP